MRRIDAGVDHADDGALAFRRRHAGHLSGPQLIRADPLRTGVGMQVQDTLAPHRSHAGQRGNALCFVGAELEREPVADIAIDFPRRQRAANVLGGTADEIRTRTVEFMKVGIAVGGDHGAADGALFLRRRHAQALHARGGARGQRRIAQRNQIGCTTSPIGLRGRGANSRTQYGRTQRDDYCARPQTQFHPILLRHGTV
jgi:hypothetical protein